MRTPIIVVLALALTNCASTTIRNQPGGEIIEFALKVAKIKAGVKQVRFTGKCDSACTLYLSLPAERLCATARASFGFHLPRGVSAAQIAFARNYLWNAYPVWARDWITAHGGLTDRIIRMPARTIRQHLPACK